MRFDTGIPHDGQAEEEQLDVTRTSMLPGVSLMDVISKSSGGDKSGVVGIPLPSLII